MKIYFGYKKWPNRNRLPFVSCLNIETGLNTWRKIMRADMYFPKDFIRRLKKNHVACCRLFGHIVEVRIEQ